MLEQYYDKLWNVWFVLKDGTVLAEFNTEKEATAYLELLKGY